MSDRQVYIVGLKSYNNGKPVGQWFEADYCLQESVAEFLQANGEEEYGIHDHEGFGSIQIGEQHDLGALETIAELLEEHDPAVVEKALEFETPDSADRWIKDNLAGVYKDHEAFGWEVIEGSGELPEHLHTYFDAERYGKDLAYDYIEVEGTDGMLYFFFN